MSYNSRLHHNSKSGRTYGQHSRSQRSRRQPKKAYIHPSRFVKHAVQRHVEAYEPQYAFSDFAVHEFLKRNLEIMGYRAPSPIQDQAIPLGLAGKDVIGIANTGTGKTAAFAIPVLHRLMAEPTSKVIILAPTRELAQQIEEQCRKIGKSTRLNGALLIGGVSMGPQLRDLKYNPRIIIGTPGRVKDHLERGSLTIADCNMVVLDEVDRMLDMGFIGDIQDILGRTNPERQCFYFSATLDERVKSIIANFSREPVHISVTSGETSDNVEQDIVPYGVGDSKVDRLHDVLIQYAPAKAIIFDDTQRSVERLSKELAARGFAADAIHGGKTQGQRMRVLQKFKNSEINVLVATDVAARGLDVPNITHVINFSLPQSYDDYVHRVGRAGRAGNIGHALTFVEA